MMLTDAAHDGTRAKAEWDARDPRTLQGLFLEAPIPMCILQVVEELRMAFPHRKLTIDASGAGDGVWDPGRIARWR